MLKDATYFYLKVPRPTQFRKPPILNTEQMINPKTQGDPIPIKSITNAIQ